MIQRATGWALLGLIFSSLLAPPARAFELNTHGEITAAAFALSSVPGVLRSLGIDPDNPLSGGLFGGSRRPDQWLDRGVRDEDDTWSTNFARYRNHFYDPVNDRGLTTSLARGERAPDWALEDRQQFPTQAFSYRDAREAFLTSFTAPAPGDREAALARTFEILGHVIHLVQDMASPPHTRNDSHGGTIFGPSSLYELHLNQPEVLGRQYFGGTPVRLALPRHYWTTGDGRGLAEFVNRNFVSEGTNFRVRVDGATGGGYPSPVLRLGVDEQGQPFEATLDIQTQIEPGLRDRNGNRIEGTLTFFANSVVDPITGEALRNERMTTLSFFDRDLERKGESLVFTQNRYTIEAQAGFLIPRAVGYSVGLLDYFFRGTLDFEAKLGATDPAQRELWITNTSSELMDGDFILYTEDASERRSALVTFPLSIPSGDVRGPLTFTPPSGVRAYALVFRGTLGAEEERAVAGKVKPWEPPFVFVIQNTAEMTGDRKKQRAAGRFLFPGEPTPGEYIKRVELLFASDLQPPPSTPEVRLRLNGIDVGSRWNREAGPVIVPITWEISLDLVEFTEPHFVYPSTIQVPRVPRIVVVELLSGTRIRTPLIWWRSADVFTLQATGQDQFPCSMNQCSEDSARDDGVTAEVFFGDGNLVGDEVGQFPLSAPRTGVSFTPTQGVMGFPVGAIEFSCTGPGCDPWFDNCSPPGEYTLRRAQIFATGGPGGATLWKKNRVQAEITEGARVRKPAGTCGPRQFTYLPPPPLPELRFRRDYLPAEQDLFEQFNIIPPEYEITLR